MPLLAVPVHLQDDPTACALACAQMVLRQVTQTLHQQTNLLPSTKDLVWATSPNQLRDMLNSNLAGTAAQPHYRVFAETTLDKAMERVAAGLASSFPVIALTGTEEHWVVVHGLTTSASSMTVHIRNPLPDLEDVVGTPPPAHSDTDVCETKDIANAGHFGGETASCREWAKTFMLKSTHAPVANKYVVIAPTLPIPPGGQYSCPAPRLRSERPIDPNNAKDWAWRVFRDTGLLSNPEWRTLGEQPLNDTNQSVRIEDARYPEDAYIIVRVESRDGHSVLIRISERSGEFLSALLEPSEQLSTSLFTPPAQLPWMRTRIEPGATTRLVWQYAETTFFSPFVPLLEVRAHNRVYYLRLYDGKRFDKIV
jgi:hypothetical protein